MPILALVWLQSGAYYAASSDDSARCGYSIACPGRHSGARDDVVRAMKLVMTMLIRNQHDVLEHNLRCHRAEDEDHDPPRPLGPDPQDGASRRPRRGADTGAHEVDVEPFELQSTTPEDAERELAESRLDAMQTLTHTQRWLSSRLEDARRRRRLKRLRAWVRKAERGLTTAWPRK
jgi:hypothetical protein